MIVDATCSRSRNWPEKADLRLDVSPLAEPDVVADARRLPLRDRSVAGLYLDPPHLVGTPGLKWARDFEGRDPLYRRFSYWPSLTAWRQFLEATLGEANRVLCRRGRVYWKVPDGSRSHGRMIHYEDVLEDKRFFLVKDRMVVGQGPRARLNVSIGKAHSTVHYLTLERA